MPAGYTQLRNGFWIKDSDRSGPYWVNFAGVPTLVSSGATPFTPNVIHNSSKIAPALASLANAGSSRWSAVVIGHSVGDGVGSDNTSNTNFTAAQTWRTNSWASRLTTLLNTNFGTTGSFGIETAALGNIGFFTGGGSIATPTAFNPGGINGYVFVFNDTDDTEAFAAKGTAVKIYGYSGASGTIPRYRINGGSLVNMAAVPVAPTGYTTQNWFSEVISGLTIGDIITVTGAASGTFRVTEVDLDYRTDPGVTIHRAAYPGMMLAQLFAPAVDVTDTQPAGNWITGANRPEYRNMQAESITTQLGVNLVMFMTDVNDMKAFGTLGPPNQAWGWTLADIIRHKTNAINWCASKGLYVLDVYGPIRDPANGITDGNPYNQDDIIAAYKAISDASTNCAYIDLTDQYVGTQAERYALQMATGRYVDTVHPNTAGHLYDANLLSAAILAA